MDSHKTKVIFRKYADGTIIALFPEIPGTQDGYTCMSYERVGQHGSCIPDYTVTVTRLAKPAEYASLKEELESIGYNLVVKNRLSDKMNEYRKLQLKRSGLFPIIER